MRAEANDFLPRLWATRRVGWLVEQVRANGENKELRERSSSLVRVTVSSRLTPRILRPMAAKNRYHAHHTSRQGMAAPKVADRSGERSRGRNDEYGSKENAEKDSLSEDATLKNAMVQNRYYAKTISIFKTACGSIRNIPRIRNCRR